MKMISRIQKALLPPGSLLRRDGVQLGAASVFIGAALLGIYALATQPVAVPDPDQAAARRAELEQQEALALQQMRSGTILFVTYSRLCEERRFDNQTGYTVGIDQVDCDERLKRGTGAQAKADGSQAKNMQGMLASFKR